MLAQPYEEICRIGDNRYYHLTAYDQMEYLGIETILEYKELNEDVKIDGQPQVIVKELMQDLTLFAITPVLEATFKQIIENDRIDFNAVKYDFQDAIYEYEKETNSKIVTPYHFDEGYELNVRDLKLGKYLYTEKQGFRTALKVFVDTYTIEDADEKPQKCYRFSFAKVMAYKSKNNRQMEKILNLKSVVLDKDIITKYLEFTDMKGEIEND